jgi:hypothetical protein
MGSEYACYLPAGGAIELDLSHTNGTFSVVWYDPRNGELHLRDQSSVDGGTTVKVDAPNEQDWILLIQRGEKITQDRK